MGECRAGRQSTKAVLFSTEAARLFGDVGLPAMANSAHAGCDVGRRMLHRAAKHAYVQRVGGGSKSASGVFFYDI
jgi:hypothetical protein